MATVTKAELTEHLVKSLNYNRQDAKTIVDEFFNVLCDTLVKGRSIKISSFGNFVLRDKSARPGRNPKTGEEKEISARRVVTFTAGHKLREMINQSMGN